MFCVNNKLKFLLNAVALAVISVTSPHVLATNEVPQYKNSNMSIANSIAIGNLINVHGGGVALGNNPASDQYVSFGNNTENDYSVGVGVGRQW